MDITFAGYRKAAGFSTQEQFAKKLGIKRSAIAKWETGRAYPQILMIPKIAKMLNITEGQVITLITAAKTRNNTA